MQSERWSNDSVNFDFDCSMFDTRLLEDDQEISDVTADSSEHSYLKTKLPLSRRTAYKTTRNSAKVKKMSIDTVLSNNAGPKVNVSRRPPSNILYAFPHFDKCDSLLYFPCTWTRHLNSGDFVALSKLFNAHMDKECKVYMDYAAVGNINIKGLLRVSEVMLDLQPDRIMCVHSTKVVENQILASIYLKCTDSKAIAESVARNVKDPVCAGLFHMNRADRMKLKINSVERSEEERVKMVQLADSGEDVLVYVRLSLALTFNDVTKKITNIVCNGQVTSMHACKDL